MLEGNRRRRLMIIAGSFLLGPGPSCISAGRETSLAVNVTPTYAGIGVFH